MKSINSKLKSLEAILSANHLSIVTLNELNLKKNKILKLGGYKAFNRNRPNGNMGGVAIAFLEKDEEDI